MLTLYRLLQCLLTPLLLVVFAARLYKGKEHATRYKERFGVTAQQRPQGHLVHLQAASVGEALSLLPLIEKLKNKTHILLTTGTVTSANLMEARLPTSEKYHIIHQFTPLDTYPTVRAFYQHWQPTITVFTESDFWPELLTQAPKPMLINARISDKSFPKYQRFSALFKPLIKRFTHVLAQQEKDAARLTTLGAQNVQVAGNLKYDAAPLPVNHTTLKELQKATKNRPILLFASTHKGEENIALTIHSTLIKSLPNLLTIIAPRHPHRGEKITHQARIKYPTAQRSKNNDITPQTHIYIADTLGELGTFYTLAANTNGVVIMGGSLVPHGGQNPLEPLRLNAPTLAGPHMHNFTDMLPSLTPLFSPAPNQEELTTQALSCLTHKSKMPHAHMAKLTGPTQEATDLILAALL